MPYRLAAIEQSSGLTRRTALLNRARGYRWRVKLRDPSSNYWGSLRAYRILAFATGIALLTATTGLIVQDVGNVSSIKTAVGLCWVAHGYLYLAYVIATVNLGIKLRWKLIRMVLVGLAGTIPTLSFVAEHYVTRDARARFAENSDRQAVA